MDLLRTLEDDAFPNLVRDAQNCALCGEMGKCNRVLTDANGDARAKIMFIGEAPGRLGAEKTVIPFHGDAAGENFDRLLRLAGFHRREVFVTNAVLCNPTDDKGNNRPPSVENIRNCANLLRRQIAVIDPDIVVTLGAKALQSLSFISDHSLALGSSVRTINHWQGRVLIPLYHPGARAMIHRNFATQTADYYFVGEAARRHGKRAPAPREPNRHKSGWRVVEYLLRTLGSTTLFRLHKILYLSDYYALRETNQRITDFFYIRQKDGPYCVELGSKWYRDFENVNFRVHAGRPHVEWEGGSLFAKPIALDDDLRVIVDRIVDSVRSLSDAQLKSRAYLTEPMKLALKAEKRGLTGLNRALL